MDKRTLMGLFIFAFSFLVIMQANKTCVIAQEVTDEDLAKIEREKKYAEARKAIAEAEAAELKANFPAGKSTPLDGKTTVNDGAVIESQMIAYAAMAQAANKIANAIHGNDPSMDVLVIYSQGEVNNLLGYRAANNQVEILKNNYCEILRPSVTSGICPAPAAAGVAPMIAAAPFTIAQSFLGGFVDTLALLRTNVEIKGQTFDIEEQALVAETFRALRKKYATDPALYYPSVYPLGIDANTESDFLEKIEGVRKLKILCDYLVDSLGKTLTELKKTETDLDGTSASIAGVQGQKATAEFTLRQLLRSRRLDASERIKIAELRTQIDLLEKSLIDLNTKKNTLIAKKMVLEGRRQSILSVLVGNFALAANADEALTKLRAANQQFDQFVASLIQVNQTTGSNLITGYIKAENLDKAMRCTGMALADGQPCSSATLQLKVIKAGGNNRIKTNLVVDVFTGGNRVSHSGGSIVQYILFDTKGKVTASDVLTVYSNYIKSNKVKNLPCDEIDDQNTDKCKK